MIHWTYEQYDKELEVFELIKESGRFKPYWPTVPQIDEMCANPRKFIKFACYLYETNPEPSNPAERYSKKNLCAYINDHLELVDGGEDEG